MVTRKSFDWNRKIVDEKIDTYSVYSTFSRPINNIIENMNDIIEEYKDKYEDLYFEFNVINGYYDDTHIECILRGKRFENDKEFDKRIVAQERVLEQAKEDRKKAREKKKDPEYEDFIRLKQKFGA